MGRGRAFARFLEGLERGDPIALGLLGFVVLLLAIAGAIWLVDYRARRKEAARLKMGAMRTGTKSSRKGDRR